MFRCFPPSSQQLDIKTDDLGAFDDHGTFDDPGAFDDFGTFDDLGAFDDFGTLDDLGTLDDPGAFPKTDSQTVERSDIRLSDCGPQGSPVAEAGPGVSYPGYKQYCRCVS